MITVDSGLTRVRIPTISPSGETVRIAHTGPMFDSGEVIKLLTVAIIMFKTYRLIL